MKQLIPALCARVIGGATGAADGVLAVGQGDFRLDDQIIDLPSTPPTWPGEPTPPPPRNEGPIPPHLPPLRHKKALGENEWPVCPTPPPLPLA